MTVPASPDVIGAATTRVLAALLAEYAEHGRATVLTVATRARRTISTTYGHLERLEAMGLVAGLHVLRGGALRPACRPVPTRTR